MHELEVVDGIDPRSLIEPNEVYVPWAEVGLLAQEVGLKLASHIDKFGPFDTIVAIKHGATCMAALLERTVPHGMLRYAKLRRRETGLTVVESPAPSIDYFPEEKFLRDKNVAIFDEVYETGKSSTRARHTAEESEPRSVTVVTLHYKPECNIFPFCKPDIYGAEIDPRYRCYPWELWERVMQARINKMQVAIAVV
ncbi:MAG: phosphoribosyltransferase [Candidatus Kerfeldbacteria bacterium]|nr:phosphoribosyltransferase [Candidatus Kerfeldbacteria bacterium]